jgi:lipase chaperone LimK
MRKIQFLLVLAIALAIGVFWWIADSDPRVGTPSTITEASPVDPKFQLAPIQRDAKPPASLRDSSVDGELLVDASGHFTPTPRTLALFDYFLSATGEEPAAQLRARIEAEIAKRLPPDAAPEANAFLDRYLGYRDAAAQMANDVQLAASGDLERRLQWLRELRREHFGAPLAATLFGDDERALEIAIEQQRVESDASLSETEKTARLEELELQLPDAAQRARQASTAPLRLFHAEQELRARGGSDAELRALRESMVGPEATARLEERDRARAAWNERLVAYRAERDAIRADAALDAKAREAAIEALRAKRFDARERIRVRVIDEMESTPSG